MAKSLKCQKLTGGDGMNTQMPKTTYYRRLRKARELGCSIDEVPDNRGKHGNHAKGSKHYRWNNGRLITPDGYVLVRVGKSHPLADPNGYCHEHKLIMCSCIGRDLLPGEVIHHKNGEGTPYHHSYHRRGIDGTRRGEVGSQLIVNIIIMV